MSDKTSNCRTRMEDAEDKLDRVERLLLKIVQHADEGAAGTEDYARDRLRQCRALAAYGVVRVIGKELARVI